MNNSFGTQNKITLRSNMNCSNEELNQTSFRKLEDLQLLPRFVDGVPPTPYQHKNMAIFVFAMAELIRKIEQNTNIKLSDSRRTALVEVLTWSLDVRDEFLDDQRAAIFEVFNWSLDDREECIKTLFRYEDKIDEVFMTRFNKLFCQDTEEEVKLKELKYKCAIGCICMLACLMFVGYLVDNFVLTSIVI